jgi:hypothetical protein
LTRLGGGLHDDDRRRRDRFGFYYNHRCRRHRSGFHDNDRRRNDGFLFDNRNRRRDHGRGSLDNDDRRGDYGFGLHYHHGRLSLESWLHNDDWRWNWSGFHDHHGWRNRPRLLDNDDWRGWWHRRRIDHMATVVWNDNAPGAHY